MLMLINKANERDAYRYYKRFIFNCQKSQLLEKYNFPLNGSVSPLDWELFAAILLDRKKKPQGADLVGYEIKSARNGSSFEYQYHKKSGIDKLEEEKKVEHIFISYSNNYKDIVVRKASGAKLEDKIKLWENDIKKNYKGRKQRCRKSLSYKYVCGVSEIILEIKNGEGIF